MNYFTPFVHIHNQQKEQRLTDKTGACSKLSLFSIEINRLLSAAVINQRFCSLLLSDPLRAIEIGFNGESFSFLHEEKVLLANIKATTLQSFAEQTMALVDAIRKGEIPVENRPTAVTESVIPMRKPIKQRTLKPTASLSSK
ncbi:hypothetical protein GC175_18930 [bacterium]|nr:hypothetical protein [bacterium]